MRWDWLDTAFHIFWWGIFLVSLFAGNAAHVAAAGTFLILDAIKDRP